MRTALRILKVLFFIVAITLPLFSVFAAENQGEGISRMYADSESNDSSSCDWLETNSSYFYDKNGRLAVNIISEGIVAYFDQPYRVTSIPQFGLVPLYIEFPAEIGTVTYYTSGYREYDWSDYQH